MCYYVSCWILLGFCLCGVFGFWWFVVIFLYLGCFCVFFVLVFWFGYFCIVVCLFFCCCVCGFLLYFFFCVWFFGVFLVLGVFDFVGCGFVFCVWCLCVFSCLAWCVLYLLDFLG